ncbi:MAG: hypothetical protein WD066_13840 [Planctomycetaceae bacterium]
MEIDRAGRERLIEAIDRFVSEGIPAFEFDDRIHAIAAASSDPTVKRVALCLWFFYDDVIDHHVAWSRQECDFVQRLVLVLRSDAHVDVIQSRKWSGLQLPAIALLLLFAMCTSWLGFGQQLFAATPVLGVASIIIAKCRNRRASAPSPERITLAPFDSIASLARIRRRVREFEKRRYRPEIETRRIRTPGREFILSLMTHAAWLLLSPLVLVFQAFPRTESELRVVEN